LIDVMELAGELLPDSSSPGGLSIFDGGLVTDFLLALRRGVLDAVVFPSSSMYWISSRLKLEKLMM
jgi:hypothetical protein